MTKVLKKKFFKYLWVSKFMYLGLLRPSTVPQVIVEVIKIVDICIKRPANLPQVITEVLDIGQVWPATLPLVIVEDMLIKVDIYNKIPDTLPLAIS